MTMLTESLMRFSSENEEVRDTHSDSGDGMSKALSKKLESLTGQTESRAVSYSDYSHLSLDDLFCCEQSIR